MIKFGVVGAGNIARKFIQDIKVVENAKVVAIASRSIDKAEAYKKEFNLDYAFSDYVALAKSDVVDAIYIATPHNFHEEQSILFMNHKKHVLCEKPIAVNKKQAQHMYDVAKQNNVLLMEAMWMRFLPASKRVLEITESKIFGEIKSIELSFCVPIGLNAPLEGRLLNPNLAGGSLLDVGIYPMSYLKYLVTDKITSIKATAVKHETGIDMYTEADVVFDNKLKTKAKIYSAFDRDFHNKAIIEYEKGTIIAPSFFSGKEVIINGQKEHYPFRSDGFEYQIESFVDTLIDKSIENDIMTHKKSLDVMDLSDKIRKEIDLKYPFE